MSLFFSYILLGLSLSAPIGPINAAQLDKGIRFGFWHAWLVGFGGMIADGIFMLLIYFGIAQFVDTPMIKAFLWSFGFFVLCYTGYESILQSGELTKAKNSGKNEPKWRSFQTGFLMAVSNPLNILFWLGIYGSMIAQSSSSYSTSQLLLYSSGIFLGITLWDITMASLATGARKWVKPKILRGISIISGIVLIGFGVYFGVQALRLLFG
ncbi:LysE family transporter [Halobacillus yeomjeoni]|uniref:LysE family transporter n=1 Tax=Halobacillus yeomjeoni TaxID=311194 RepID=A0A931MVT8_9BACI|nr:LysE family transporter [Halobacillus yeomjeoni]MBH0230970.1 LysE family transporter [Halobacillus yeomjeoni]